MQRGQSLVVHAIASGRKYRSTDLFFMGKSDLHQASMCDLLLVTHNFMAKLT